MREFWRSLRFFGRLSQRRKPALRSLAQHKPVRQSFVVQSPIHPARQFRTRRFSSPIPPGQTVTGTSSRDGAYEIRGLAAGKYSLKVSANGFQDFQNLSVDIAQGQVKSVDAPLIIQVQQQKVEVTSAGGAGTLDVNPENNAGAIVLKGQRSGRAFGRSRRVTVRPGSSSRSLAWSQRRTDVHRRIHGGAAAAEVFYS